MDLAEFQNQIIVGAKDPKGPKGPQGIPYGRLESVFDTAFGLYGARKETTLLGHSKTPPDAAGCDFYIYYNGGGAEFFRREGSNWVNLSYREY